MSGWLTRLGVPLLLAGVALIIFWPGIHGDLFFDSIPNIASNKLIQVSDLKPASLLAAALSFSQGGIGRPIPMLTFALDWYLAGPNPAWFKLVNLLIHCVNAVLIYTLALRLIRLGDQMAGHPRHDHSAEWIAVLAALLWTIAPIHGFTVVYVVQRMVLLNALWSLLCLHAYLSLRAAVAVGSAGRTVLAGGILLLTAVLALLSKETAVIIPFYIAVIEVFLLRFAGLGRARLIFLTAVWLAVLTPILALWYTVSHSPAGISAGYELRNFGPVERMLTQARVLVMYLRNIIVPDYGQLHFFYDNLAVSRSLIEPVTTGLSLAFLGALACSAVVLRQRLPILGFAVFWFLVGHSLESSFWPLEMVFWHRNYLPSFGPLLALAYGLIWLACRTGAARAAGVGAILLLIALAAGQSRMIAEDWSDRVALARAEITKNPDSARAVQNYARMAVFSSEQNDDPSLLPEAAVFYRRAMDLDPSMLHPVYGLIYLAVIHEYGALPGAMAALQERAATQAFGASDISVLESLVALRRHSPARVDLFDVLEVLDAAADNPRLAAWQRAYALAKKSELLSREGLPAATYMPELRRAVCLVPGAADYRFLLLRTLVEQREFDEAASLLNPPFPFIERLKDPRIGAYEAALNAYLKGRANGQVSPSKREEPN